LLIVLATMVSTTKAQQPDVSNPNRSWATTPAL
jgi:hypothetical protein